MAREIQQIMTPGDWGFRCTEEGGGKTDYPLVAWVLTKEATGQTAAYKLEGAYVEQEGGKLVILCEDHPGFEYYRSSTQRRVGGNL